jgi:uncharacterized membrane protein YeaQ/YmgE (transglycosylase-associated protein family)
MSLIVTLIIGAVIGWLASLLMKTDAQMGIIANIVVGIVGAALGHWLAGALGIVTVGSVGAWIVSILGAVILLAILKALNIFR